MAALPVCLISERNQPSLSRTGTIQFAEVGQRLGDLSCERHRLRAAQVDDLLGDAQLEKPATEIDEPAAVLAVPAKLDAPPVLSLVAADRAQSLHEHRRELLALLDIPAGDVPDIGVACDKPKRCNAGGTNPDRRTRPLDRFRVCNRVLQVVVAAVEVRALLGPQRLDDPQGLAEHPDAVVEPFDPVHLMLDLSPRRPDAELQPAARQVVDGDGHLGQDDRVAIGVGGDQAAESHALGGLGHRRLQRPALVDHAIRTAGADRGQVVEIPNVVETAFVRDAPDRAQLLDGGVLAGELEPGLRVDKERLAAPQVPNRNRLRTAIAAGGHEPDDDLLLQAALDMLAWSDHWVRIWR